MVMVWESNISTERWDFVMARVPSTAGSSIIFTFTILWDNSTDNKLMMYVSYFCQIVLEEGNNFIEMS